MTFNFQTAWQKFIMRIAILALTLLSSSYFTITEAFMEDKILQFLEEFRIRMCHDLPKFRLPALDPLNITHVEHEMNNKYIVDFKCSLTNFLLTGLSDFIVNDLKITNIPLKRSSVNVTMPLTAFTSFYTATGSLAYILNLVGDGRADAELQNASVAIQWKFVTGVHLSVKDLNIKILIGGIQIDFENLIEEKRINNFFHALINEMGVELLNDVWQGKNQFVATYIENLINEFLHQYTFNDIIKIIRSVGNGPIFDDNDPPGDCKQTSS